MNLQAQIELITNPQDFTRLYNAVLIAEYGDDYTPVDDDRADRGNDGYLKSEKRLFAGHCFKRIQKQSIDSEIRSKVEGDLEKAIQLKESGTWEVEAWTFLSNYPIPESIAGPLIKKGKEASIDVSWRGPEYFAGVLQKYKDVRSQFPNLMGNEVMDRLETIIDLLEKPDKPAGNTQHSRLGVPRNEQQKRRLLHERPIGWEYLLFAGVLFLGRERLELKWHDHEMRYGRQTGRSFSDKEAVSYISSARGRLAKVTKGITLAFDDEWQEKAFGKPGEPGDPLRIEHFGDHIIGCYNDMLDWAADIRGSDVSDNMSTLFELAARIADQPLQDIRNFIDQVVTGTDKIPEHVASNREQPLRLELTLTLTVDDKVVGEMNKVLKKTAKRVR